MPSDEYYHDCYDYIEWDGGPYSAVDDLAEHTMHSPVWISYDPDHDIADYISDWEISPDEYFDEGSSTARKRKAGKGNGKGGHQEKRRKLQLTKKISTLSLGEATPPSEPVVWRARDERLRSPDLPVLREGDAGRVALLKDWRETLNISNGTDRPKPAAAKARKQAREASQPRVAPLANGPLNAEDEERALQQDTTTGPDRPPTSLTQESTSPLTEQHIPSYMSGTSSTLAKRALRQASMADQEQASHTRKRRVSNPSDQQDEDASRAKRVRPIAKVDGTASASVIKSGNKGDAVKTALSTKSLRKRQEAGDDETGSANKKSVLSKKQTETATVSRAIPEKKIERQTRRK
ncbi:MAG: hypothetical protein Q9217_001386 [Psora testacea]